MAKANTVKPAMARGDCLVVATMMRHVRLFSNSHDMILEMPLPATVAAAFDSRWTGRSWLPASAAGLQQLDAIAEAAQCRLCWDRGVGCTGDHAT